MRIVDISVGDKVKVRRGYSIRPAIVTDIYNGLVSVKFTDIDVDFLATRPCNLQNYFGAAVRPNAIEK